jgi:pilus assembly protein CpaF
MAVTTRHQENQHVTSSQSQTTEPEAYASTSCNDAVALRARFRERCPRPGNDGLLWRSDAHGDVQDNIDEGVLDHIPENERLLIIEQPAELKVSHPNAVRWEAVEEIPGQVAITPSELLAAALRHRPDRIIMGEIRNECGYDLLQAMNTGHGGTLSTIHAKSAWDALNRLANLALSARPNLNHAFMRSETAEAIDFVLYCERDHTGRRRVRELIMVNGYSHADQSFQTEEVYRASAA